MTKRRLAQYNGENLDSFMGKEYNDLVQQLNEAGAPYDFRSNIYSAYVYLPFGQEVLVNHNLNKVIVSATALYEDTTLQMLQTAKIALKYLYDGGRINANSVLIRNTESALVTERFLITLIGV